MSKNKEDIKLKNFIVWTDTAGLKYFEEMLKLLKKPNE